MQTRNPPNGVGSDIAWILIDNQGPGAGYTGPRDIQVNGAWTGRTSGGTPQGLSLYLQTGLSIPSDSSGNTPNGCSAILSGSTWSHWAPLTVVPALSGGSGTIYAGYRHANNSMSGGGTLGSHGASGMSAVGGCIRTGELANGINHAMLIEPPMGYYGRTDGGHNGGPAYCAPAASADGYAITGPGNYGQGVNTCWMGSLIYIRTQDQATALGLCGSGPGRAWVNAMVGYGAYIVDDSYYIAGGGGWEHWNIPIDNVAGSNGEDAGLYTDIQAILANGNLIYVLWYIDPNANNS